MIRQPRPSDVLEAVRYVTGTDPVVSCMDRQSKAASKRLAAACLRDICGLGPRAIGRQLDIEHGTASYHLSRFDDWDSARMVVQRVSDKLEAEAHEQERQRVQWAQ